MPVYLLTIEETITWTIKVEAPSEEDAKERASFGVGDIVDRNASVEPPKVIKVEP